MNSVYDLEICDCHHHLWDLKANYYPWLTDTKKERVCGDYEAIRKKNFLLPDFFANRGKLNVIRMIHEEAVVDRSDPVAETRWLQSVADAPGSGGFPHGIVAFADFSRDDIESVLEEHCAYPNIRGIRQFVHEAYIDPANPQPCLLDDPVWRKRVGLCQTFGLSFDLQIYYQQAAGAGALVAQHPEQRFALTHIGQPARQDPENLAGWKQAIRQLSALPNLSVKLSGFGMFDRNWNADTVRPLILHAIECFGPERCMFASNFPVDSLANVTYAGLWENYYHVVADFSGDEKRALFCGNARAFYRV